MALIDTTTHFQLRFNPPFILYLVLLVFGLYFLVDKLSNHELREFFRRFFPNNTSRNNQNYYDNNEYY